MNVNYLNPFIEASMNVVKDIAGVDSELQKVCLRGNTFSGKDVIIIIGVTGALVGQVILTLNHLSMDMLVKHMFAGDSDNLDIDLKKSAMAELANMIVGNATSLFYKKGMKVLITTPTILTGKDILISNKYPIICIPIKFSGDDVGLDLNVSAIENTNPENFV
ncbi:MAG: chemotaxis protein CheX [Deltaproteobacteria bacterium]